MRHVYVEPKELLEMLTQDKEEAASTAQHERTFLPTRRFYKAKAMSISEVIDYLEEELRDNYLKPDPDAAYRQTIAYLTTERQGIITDDEVNNLTDHQGWAEGFEDCIKRLRFARHGHQ